VSKSLKFHRILAAGVLALALGISACTPEKPVATDKVDLNAGYDLASVNYQELVVLHPNYQELLQIDEEIAKKEQEKGKLGAAAFQELQKEGAGKMRSAVESAKAKLEAEKAAVEGEMASLSASLSAQIEGEMKGIQSQLQAELEADVKKLKESAPVKEDVAAPEPDPLLGRNEGQVQDYLANLALVRERNLAARRLELEKRVGDEVNAKKAEVDGQVAAYEAELSAQYQGERLNLQLTAQNSVDEAAKTAAEARLAEISQTIDAQKATRRAELDAGYAAVRAEKTAQLQGELEAYQAELNAEVSAKVAAKRQELGISAPAAPRPKTPQGPPPEIQAKIAEMQARMNAELESKKAQLQGQMAGKAEEAKGRLQAKQAQVEAELKAIEAKITEDVKKRINELNPKTKVAVQKVEKEVEALQKQRKELAEKIAADISREVGEVAKKKEVDMVVGVVPNFEYSSYPDVTEQAKVAIQTEDSK
jgi:hypothetical protein